MISLVLLLIGALLLFIGLKNKNKGYSKKLIILGLLFIIGFLAWIIFTLFYIQLAG